MQVTLNVSEEIIERHGSDFQETDGCPIAKTLEALNVLEEDVSICVTYDGIELYYGEEEYKISFDENVPEDYRHANGDLTPFQWDIEIPDGFTKAYWN